jgi:hypothetical protein
MQGKHYHIEVSPNDMGVAEEEVISDQGLAIVAYDEAIKNLVREDGVSIFSRGIRVTTLSNHKLVIRKECSGCDAEEGVVS